MCLKVDVTLNSSEKRPSGNKYLEKHFTKDTSLLKGSTLNLGTVFGDDESSFPYWVKRTVESTDPRERVGVGPHPPIERRDARGVMFFLKTLPSTR